MKVFTFRWRRIVDRKNENESTSGRFDTEHIFNTDRRWGHICRRQRGHENDWREITEGTALMTWFHVPNMHLGERTWRIKYFAHNNRRVRGCLIFPLTDYILWLLLPQKIANDWLREGAREATTVATLPHCVRMSTSGQVESIVASWELSSFWSFTCIVANKCQSREVVDIYAKVKHINAY